MGFKCLPLEEAQKSSVKKQSSSQVQKGPKLKKTMNSSKRSNFTHHPPGKGHHAGQFPARGMKLALVLITEKEGVR